MSSTLLFPKPTKQEKKRKTLKRRGRKTDAWEKTRAELKVRFTTAGITSCELGYFGCYRDNFLSFAHARKRRFITDEDELSKVALLCQNCHQHVEYQRDMTQIIEGVIARRKVKV